MAKKSDKPDPQQGGTDSSETKLVSGWLGLIL